MIKKISTVSLGLWWLFQSQIIFKFYWGCPYGFDGPVVSAPGVRSRKYYLKLLRASEGTLSRWSRLYLQSLALTPFSRRVDVNPATGRKIIAKFLTQRDEKHVVGTDPT
jgi:hypothetical protein